MTEPTDPKPQLEPATGLPPEAVYEGLGHITRFYLASHGVVFDEFQVSRQPQGDILRIRIPRISPILVARGTVPKDT